MENIEELLRDAFKAGMNKGSHQSYFDAPLDETEYIDSIKDKLKLFFIPVVVSTLPCEECDGTGKMWSAYYGNNVDCDCKK